MQSGGVSHQEVHKALGDLRFRISTTIRSREIIYWQLKPPLALVNPIEHENEIDMADSLLHAIIHHLRPELREASIRPIVSDMLTSPYLERRLYKRLCRAMMIYLGGGTHSGVVAGR